MKLQKRDVKPLALALAHIGKPEDNKYDFPTKVRVSIGRSLRIVTEIADEVEKERMDIVKALKLGTTRTDENGNVVSADNPAAQHEYFMLNRELMHQEVEVPISCLLMSTLNLDKNKIQGGAIAGLLPIITEDVTALAPE